MGYCEDIDYFTYCVVYFVQNTMDLQPLVDSDLLKNFLNLDDECSVSKAITAILNNLMQCDDRDVITLLVSYGYPKYLKNYILDPEDWKRSSNEFQETQQGAIACFTELVHYLANQIIESVEYSPALDDSKINS